VRKLGGGLKSVLLAHAQDFGRFSGWCRSGIFLLPKQLRSHAQRLNFSLNSLYFQLLTLEHFGSTFHGSSRLVPPSDHFLAGQISLQAQGSGDHITEVQGVFGGSTSVPEVIGMAL
jgi:hypothetical protein